MEETKEALCFRCKIKTPVDEYSWDVNGKPRISGKCKRCSGNVSSFISKADPNRLKKPPSSVIQPTNTDPLEQSAPL